LSLRTGRPVDLDPDEYYNADGDSYWIDSIGFVQLQRQPLAGDLNVFADEAFTHADDSAEHAFRDSLIPWKTHTEVIDGITTIIIDSAPEGSLYSKMWETPEHTTIYACDYGAEERVASWSSRLALGENIDHYITRIKNTDGSVSNYESDITELMQIRLVRDV
jgi:hypothetical protein